MAIHGVIFDMDNTIADSSLDFGAIRREIGLGPGPGPVLERLSAMAPAQRRRAEAILDRHEREGAMGATAIPGAPELVAWLGARGLRAGLLTRNSRASAHLTLERLGLAFDPVLAREDGPIKPAPDAVLRICRTWQLQPDTVLVVGDYLFDVQAGRAAGCCTILLTHGNCLPYEEQADYVVADLRQCRAVVESLAGRVPEAPARTDGTAASPG